MAQSRAKSSHSPAVGGPKSSDVESIGVRLGSERHRLDLTQDELAKIGGVSRRAQARYESNRHSPTAAYLSAAAEAGLDVAYILTGRPSSTVNPQLLSKCIAALEKWQRQKERRLSPEGQAY